MSLYLCTYVYIYILYIFVIAFRNGSPLTLTPPLFAPNNIVTECRVHLLNVI